MKRCNRSFKGVQLAHTSCMSRACAVKPKTLNPAATLPASLGIVTNACTPLLSSQACTSKGFHAGRTVAPQTSRSATVSQSAPGQRCGHQRRPRSQQVTQQMHPAVCNTNFQAIIDSRLFKAAQCMPPPTLCRPLCAQLLTAFSKFTRHVLSRPKETHCAAAMGRPYSRALHGNPRTLSHPLHQHS